MINLVALEDDLARHQWLASTETRPGAWMQSASCFVYLYGRDAEVVARDVEGLEVVQLDLRDDPDAAEMFFNDDSLIAVMDAGCGWTVAYASNGYPEQWPNKLAENEAVPRSVVVYWNVNMRYEFSYRETGHVVFCVRDSDDGIVDDSTPFALDIRETVERRDDLPPYASMGAYYGLMLSLAGRITGIHLDAQFLRRELFAVTSLLASS